MIYFLIVLAVASCGLTSIIRNFALKSQIIDIPNHRSAHIVPTPRGGGIAFVIVFLLAIIFLNLYGLLTIKMTMAFIGAGGVIALIGFFDDRASIPSRWRFIVHLMASILALYCLNGMPSITIFNIILPSGYISHCLAVLYLCWLLNLYNFMDGIDGIAGIEAITVCCGAALLYWLAGERTLMVLPLLLSAAVLGFLFWNFPLAHIFMGDAGSGFLGFVLGILSIYAATIKMQFFYSWLILLGVFIIDATMTLFNRLFQKQKIYEAHQSHAYQHASREFVRHIPVTLAVLMLNVCWLCPIAILVGLDYLSPMIGLGIAYLPLLVLAIQFKAGKSR